eukprot:1136827-Pelagomonas_calceolata.AAC.1
MHHFCQQLHAHDCDQAYTTLISWIMRTACHPYVGMTRPLNYSVPSGHHFPTRKPLWGGMECLSTTSMTVQSMCPAGQAQIHTVKHVTPISAAAWQGHLNAAFRHRADRPAM